MAGKPKDGDGERDRDVGTLTRPTESPETVTKKKLERPPLYEVLLHNDDYTTQEFVVYVLMKFFQHDATTARKIMLHVHTKGHRRRRGLSRSTSPRPRRTRWSQFARENEMPLQARCARVRSMSRC